MTTYDIHLEGVHAVDLSMAVLRDVAELIVEGASRAARLAVEGRSLARGSAPSWLAAAADVRMSKLEEGSLRLAVQARPLAESVPDLAQQPLFGVRNVDATSVDLFMDAMEDALAGRRDSERVDAGMLKLLVDTQNLFGRGATGLTFSRPGGKRVSFGRSDVKTFQVLVEATPDPQVDRIVGVLDSVTLSTRTFLVRIDEKSSLRGLAGSQTVLETLKGQLGARVVVEGTVAFRASGRPQRIDADFVALASDRDSPWARLPRGETRAILTGSASGDLASLFGQWPGTETDQEVFAALDEIS